MFEKLLQPLLNISEIYQPYACYTTIQSLGSGLHVDRYCFLKRLLLLQYPSTASNRSSGRLLFKTIPLLLLQYFVKTLSKVHVKCETSPCFNENVLGTYVYFYEFKFFKLIQSLRTYMITNARIRHYAHSMQLLYMIRFHIV